MISCKILHPPWLFRVHKLLLSVAIKAVAILSRNIVTAARPFCILIGIHILDAFYQNTQFPSGQKPKQSGPGFGKEKATPTWPLSIPAKGSCTTCSMKRSEVTLLEVNLKLKSILTRGLQGTEQFPAAEELRNGTYSSLPLQQEPQGRGYVITLITVQRIKPEGCRYFP